jgi:hypothetical protein
MGDGESGRGGDKARSGSASVRRSVAADRVVFSARVANFSKCGRGMGVRMIHRDDLASHVYS